ncbi:MAG: sigma-54 interaction domain-containing protein [Desulfatibacillaceae bacterium]
MGLAAENRRIGEIGKIRTAAADSATRPGAFHGIMGQSPRMQAVYRMVGRIARTDSTVIVYGQTGTGKGMVARALHDHSPRAGGPFVSINCGAIPENLLESELFGHTAGAFTGATSAKTGKFELADGGTLFLDEIGDMSHDLQVKLLKVLEEKEIERVGGTKRIRVDVRIVAATHRDLEREVEAGRFREDLYYRLYVIPIQLCPLKERRMDIPLLFHHFLGEINQRCACEIGGITERAMDALVGHEWPGNVRELRNVVERMVVLKGEGKITFEDLPAGITGGNAIPIMPSVEITDDGISFQEAVTEYEKALIAESLKKANGVKNRAAQLLHLKRTTLVEKIKRYELAD